MTAAFLQSELASLIQDSKRRQSDVRTAAEKSVADLKAIQVTSETQLAGDLLRRPQFIDPFILACNSKYVKLAVTGAICLQRLVASRAISPSRLADVLDAYQEAAQQGLDVQLKILQALPSLLQLYAIELRGDALAKILSLCVSLAGSKTTLVSSSAIATFQQLITTLFERQSQRKGQDESDDEDNGLDDAANVFNDMCVVIGGEQPQFLRPQGLTLPIALEVVELSLSNPKVSILDIPSCSATCKSFLIPGMTQILERSSSFCAFGRSLRTLYLLVTRELDHLLSSLPQPFSVVLSIMDRPSGPPWRRLLCLEFMKNIISDSQLFRTIYASFDGKENERSIIGDLMSVLVRIAAEDPALIGLGRQSTIPTNSDIEDANTGGGHVDVDAVGNVLQASSNVTGISSRWSTLGSPLLEQLDQQTPPEIPETYVYTLVLGCVASLSDGLSKYIMPLSVPNRPSFEISDVDNSEGVPARKNSLVRRAEKYQRLLNPLKRDNVVSKEEVLICARMIEDCWPAVLATCSTFLNSALDSYFYHILVRTVQKLAQVSGVLELFTPRDALLTTLAKVSVPLNASSLVTALHGTKLAKVPREDENNKADDASIMSPIVNPPKLSVDVSRQTLNVRNLLCLRALLNLGIALGPTLTETSWFIIIQALQQADALMSVHPATRSTANKSQTQEDTDMDSQTSLGSEITAVATASRRMLESTKTYPDEILEVLLHSVFKMIETLIPNLGQSRMSRDVNGKQELKVTPQKHKATRSVSGAPMTAVILHVEAEFVLKTVSDLARINLYRFCSNSSQSCSWDLVAVRLLSIVADNSINSQLRLQAASVLDSISTEAARMLEKQDQDAEELHELQNLCLHTLAKQISLLYKRENVQQSLVTDVEIHRRLLEALENIVSHSGDSLTSGWRIVFKILQRTTRQTTVTLGVGLQNSQDNDQEMILERTIPPAFRTVQLIVSDFLNTIDPLSFSILVQLLPSFGVQKNDLNISLTTTVLFSDLSSLLLERTDLIEVPITHADGTNGANGDSAMIERIATDVSSLWFAIVLQLCFLCKDDRGDVRNSALRVLIRVFDSSGPQLSANTWNSSLQEALLPVLNEYSSQDQDTASWHASYTQLLQGIVGLFVPNAETITACTGFAMTWEILNSVLKTKLAEKSFEGHTVVFSSQKELLLALRSTKIKGKDFAIPVLQGWAENHPAKILVEEDSNQDALCAHALLFKAITENADDIIRDFSMDGHDLVDLALGASKHAILASVHPPYSSDVTKMAPEQLAIVDNLEIIKKMMSYKKQEYSTFLLDLIDSMLERNTAVNIDQQKNGKGSRNLKQPTLVALMSQCITLFRRISQAEATNDHFISNISVTSALLVLRKVVVTKYTNVPTNNEVPAWQNATGTIVELVEVIQNHISCLNIKDTEMLSLPLAHAIEAILTAPALERKEPLPSANTILKDETFDIGYSTRFHKASIPLLQLPDFPDQHRKQYIATLFHASLIAKPWFGDLPPDLSNNPLSNFEEVRPGSIRPPDFLSRTKIPYEALDALLGLVSSSHNSHADSTDRGSSLIIAKTAAPYILLRIAHTIKVFLADQRLRNLIPPAKPLQLELDVILNKALQLRVVDEAFLGLSSGASTIRAGVAAGDGKTHLRLLYPLILRLKEFWMRLPRLRVCAWQDGEDGKRIEEALDGWGRVLAEGWELST